MGTKIDPQPPDVARDAGAMRPASEPSELWTSEAIEGAKIDPRLRDLAWPPTHAHYVSRLRFAVVELADAIGELFDDESDVTVRGAWIMLRCLHDLLDLSILIPGTVPDADGFLRRVKGEDRGMAEDWLHSLWDQFWPVDPDAVSTDFVATLHTWKKEGVLGALNEIVNMLPMVAERGES